MSFNSNHWFICPRANPEAEIRLFLFPYAGAGPPAFNQWTSGFPGKVEIYIAHYPARGSRYHEPPIKQVNVLAARFSQALRPLFNKPFAFFGHSLGGLVAFELAKQLRQQELPQPQILFVSACGAPHLPDPNPPIHEYSDSEFIKSLLGLHGIPAELLDQPEAMQLLLPILRADFEAIESYQYQPDASPLQIPILAFAGLDDPHVNRERVEGWALHTDAGFKSQYFPGDHFFINTCREAVIAVVGSELVSYYEKN
jgi:medium-chain acyl-[acyl-carrier-protein] hydrolase